MAGDLSPDTANLKTMGAAELLRLCGEPVL
jgi:hypothetical protein